MAHGIAAVRAGEGIERKITGCPDRLHWNSFVDELHPDRLNIDGLMVTAFWHAFFAELTLPGPTAVSSVSFSVAKQVWSASACVVPW